MPSQTVDRRRGVQSGCIIHSELLILRRHEIPPKQLIEFKQRCSDGYRENSFVEELNKKSAPCPDCNPIENIIPEVGQWAAMWTASYIPLLLSTLFVLFQYTMTVDAVSKKKKIHDLWRGWGHLHMLYGTFLKGKNMYFKDINITHGHDCRNYSGGKRNKRNPASRGQNSTGMTHHARVEPSRIFLYFFVSKPKTKWRIKVLHVPIHQSLTIWSRITPAYNTNTGYSRQQRAVDWTTI